ncbi:MAG TPA: lysylphosphatidylglycerol synthase domain-containing protein [Gemmatimonadales bacterium]|jgi:hypothetical protein
MRRLWLAVQILAAAAVAWFVGSSVVKNWGALRESRGIIHLDPIALAVSAAIILAAYAFLISAWRAVLMGWNEKLRYLAAARIWSLSNLARYVPGRIWQIAGMAAMARRAGVSPWAAAGSAVVVQLLAIATGALVTGIAAPQAGQGILIAAAGLGAAAVAAFLAWPPAVQLLSQTLVRLTGKEIRIEPVRAGPLLMSMIVTTLGWIAYGIALYFFIQGMLGEPLLPLVRCIGVFTASYLVGLIIVFTPGGLGVREGTMYILLKEPLGPAAALVITFGSRILLTSTELIAAALAMALTPRLAAEVRTPESPPA